jgi:hypothetical protein
MPVGARFSAHVQTGPGAHPTSCTMDGGSFPGVKRPQRGVDHPLPSSAEVKERVELYLCFPSGPSWPVLEWTFYLFAVYFFILPLFTSSLRIILVSIQFLHTSLHFLNNFLIFPFLSYFHVSCYVFLFPFSFVSVIAAYVLARMTVDCLLNALISPCKHHAARSRLQIILNCQVNSLYTFPVHLGTSWADRNNSTV